MKEKCLHCDEKLPYEMELCPKCGYSEKLGLPVHKKVWKVGMAVVGIIVVLAITGTLLQSEGCQKMLKGLGDSATEKAREAQAKIECEVVVLKWWFDYSDLFDYTLYADLRIQNKTNRKINALIAVEIADDARNVTLADSDTVELLPLQTKDVKWHNKDAEEAKKNRYRFIGAKVLKVD